MAVAVALAMQVAPSFQLLDQVRASPQMQVSGEVMAARSLIDLLHDAELALEPMTQLPPSSTKKGKQAVR